MSTRLEPSAPLRVVVAGATGFVGQAVVQALSEHHEVVGLTRSESHGAGVRPGTVGLRARACDLFSALDVERALEGAHVGIYLIHSMLPSARLTQGSFADLDLILADNFARGAEKAGLQQVIYLGGLIPRGELLSPHLASRLEVEETFQAHRTPVTCLRAGLIIGPSGSSFRIVEKLVRRLPVMLTPSWSRLPTQPIALEDVVALIQRCVGRREAFNRTYDIGGPDVTTYSGLMQETARALGVRRRFLPVPFLSPGLSTLWLTLITRVPLSLVSPLVQSLRHRMVPHDRALQEELGLPGLSLSDAVEHAIAHPETTHPGLGARGQGTLWESDVRSIQRLPLPEGWRAQDVAREYLAWLPRLFRAGLRVETDATGDCRFLLRGLSRPLLELTYSPERSRPQRQLFYVTGGLLARTQKGRPGRLEFREVLGGRYVLAAVHDFTPTLPWFIYKFTQALVHLAVMRRFGHHLRRAGRAPSAPPPA